VWGNFQPMPSIVSFRERGEISTYAPQTADFK
jgi:hypothetical protein